MLSRFPFFYMARRHCDDSLAIIGLTLATLITVGCENMPELPTSTTSREIPAVANTLSSTTSFTPRTEIHPTITPETAENQAIAYVRTFGPFHRSRIEATYGQSVDFGALVVGAGTQYVSTPYSPLPAEAHPGFRKGLGPFYIVPILIGDVQIFAVAVSAYNVDVAVQEDQLRMPRWHGNDFKFRILSSVAELRIPRLPHDVSELVRTATGVLPVGEPTLVWGGLGTSPLAAYWRVVLPRAVGFTRTSDGASTSTRVLYVTHDDRFAAPAPIQNQSLRFAYLLPRERTDEPEITRSITLDLHENTAFDMVSAGR